MMSNDPALVRNFSLKSMLLQMPLLTRRSYLPACTESCDESRSIAFRAR